jgi:membrane protein DedA with SNARE-associated domain
MEAGIQNLGYLEHVSYLGIFFAVAFSGYAIPVPEELVLILAGYLAAEHIIHLPIVVAVGILGAICGDNLIFYLSGHGSRFTQKYHDRVEKTHAGWYTRHVRDNTFNTVFISRFLVGMRFLNPLVSGLLRVRWKTFVTATALSAAIYIPFVVLVGYYFHDQIGIVVKIAESVRHLIFLGLIIGSGILIYSLLRNLLEKKR